MESIELVLAMLLAAVASGYLVRIIPFSLPLPLIQISLGAVISGVFERGVTLDPQIFFLLFLPPLLFLDGWRIPKDGLLRDKAAILEMSLGLVIFTVLGAGFLIHLMIPAMPLPVAFALAAVVSPTDPVALAAIKGRAPIPKRLMHILEGESLLNDATGLVCFRFAVAAAMTGSFSLLSASQTFMWVSLAGAAIGVMVIIAIAAAQEWLGMQFGEHRGAPILMNLLMPFGAYLTAEYLHASGILAAVSAGITMSYIEMRGRAYATMRVQRTAVWDMMHFTLNSIVFVLLGEQLPAILRDAAVSVEQSGHLNPWWLAIYALAINIGLILLRLTWVWASLRLTLFRASLRGESMATPHWRIVLATSLAGVRGAITMAGVLGLPFLMPDGSPFPARDLAVFLAASVILLSLITASIGLPPLLKGLELPKASAETEEEDRARQAAAAAGIAAVEKTHLDVPHDSDDAGSWTDAAARVIAVYRLRLDRLEGEAAQLRMAEKAERELRLAGLQAERETLYSLLRQNSISEETARKLIREVDLIETRFRLR